MKWKVGLTRTVVQVSEVEVEADNEELAYEAAVKIAEEHDDINDRFWSDSEVSEAESEYFEEVAPEATPQ
jgi:hypothetical protein